MPVYKKIRTFTATEQDLVMLETVARPMWLSGIRNADATLLNTPI